MNKDPGEWSDTEGGKEGEWETDSQRQIDRERGRETERQTDRQPQADRIHQYLLNSIQSLGIYLDTDIYKSFSWLLKSYTVYKWNTILYIYYNDKYFLALSNIYCCTFSFIKGPCYKIYNSWKDSSLARRNFNIKFLDKDSKFILCWLQILLNFCLKSEYSGHSKKW